MTVVMNASNIKNILEAALMVSQSPLSLDRLQALFAHDAVQPDRDVIRSALQELAEECNGRGIELSEVASGWRYQVRADYAEWVNRLWDEKPPRYSRALLETLAIIAYRQPITRGEIEDIRGVSVNTNIVRTLQEREWIKVVGHRDVPGKPELLATTRQFLDYFNLKKLSDLPSLAEIRDLDQINPDLFEQLDGETSQQQPGAVDTGTGQTDMLADETAPGDMLQQDEAETVTGVMNPQDQAEHHEPEAGPTDDDTDDKIVQFSK
jgi:segregation and condensation protein B